MYFQEPSQPLKLLTSANDEFSPMMAYFEPMQISESRWVVRAQTPAGEQFYVDEGFQTQAEADAWIVSDKRREWLRERGWVHWEDY